MEALKDILARTPLPAPGRGPAADAPRGDAAPAPGCAICHGRHWLRREVPIGHPDFGRPVPCACIAAQVAARTYAVLAAQSQLAALGDCTFASFDAAWPGIGEALVAAQIFADTALEQAGWLVLQGPPGSGKTHLAAAIGHAVVRQGQAVYFTGAADLFDHLRASYAPGSELSYDTLFEQVRRVPLLILDDLGVEAATSWVREKLYQLLNHRYVERLATVVTTNQALSLFDSRLASRLGDRRRGVVVHLHVPDYRGR